MKVKLLGIKGSWREVADAARTTVGKKQGRVSLHRPGSAGFS